MRACARESGGGDCVRKWRHGGGAEVNTERNEDAENTERRQGGKPWVLAHGHEAGARKDRARRASGASD